MIRGYQHIWAKKLTKEKLTKFIKTLKLYELFIHNLLYQNVLITANLILLTCTKSIFTLPLTFEIS